MPGAMRRPFSRPNVRVYELPARTLSPLPGVFAKDGVFLERLVPRTLARAAKSDQLKGNSYFGEDK
jgi:hypothetical protein